MSMDNSVSSFFDNQIMNTDSHFCQNGSIQSLTYEGPDGGGGLVSLFIKNLAHYSSH